MPKTLRERFINSVQRGTGGAVLLLEEYPGLAVEDIIRRACLHNFANDPQCEGPRAEYAWRLIERAENREQLIKQILRVLVLITPGDEDRSGRDLAQRIAMLGLLARKGVPGAREALYMGFDQHPNPSEAGDWQDAIIELDGLTGALHVVRCMGTCFRTHKDDGMLPFFFDRCKEILPSEDVEGFLRGQAQRDLAVRTYLKVFDGVKASFSSGKRVDRDYTYYTKIVRGKLGVTPIRPITHPGKMDLERLFDDFLSEREPERVERYARLLCRFPVKRSLDRWMSLARSGQGLVVDSACQALSHFKDEKVRALALTRIKGKRRVPDFLALLSKNYRPGDGRMISRLIQKARTRQDVHALVHGTLLIYERNTESVVPHPLQLMYDRLDCGIHRQDVVQLLWKQGLMSERVFKELEFDSYEPLNALHRKIHLKRKRSPRT